MATVKGKQLATDLGLPQYGQYAETCSKIMRHATTLQRLAEEECNGPGDWVNRIPYPEAGLIYDKWQARIEKQQASLSERVRVLCGRLPGVEAVTIGGDPRGVVVKLQRTDKQYNTWGGESSGWAVPLN